MKRTSRIIEEKDSSIGENNKHEKLPAEFEKKNSVLTEFSKNKHAATVYNLFSTILLFLFLNALIGDYLYNGEINLGFNLLIKGYSKLHICVAIWLGMFAASFLCYYGFQLWALLRIRLPRNSLKAKLWDKFMIGLVIIYYSCFLYYPPLFIRRNEIPIAASGTLLCDSVRMLMVFHSFIRTNAACVLRNFKEDESVIVPSLSKFLYFYFAPTVVYKEVSDLNISLGLEKKNWKIILGYMVEFAGNVLLLGLLLEIFFINRLKDYGLRPYSGKEIVMSFLNTSMMGLLFISSIFYIILHVWSNMFAELMRFPDRTFYKDWWTSANYERYYRTWNVVVHNWLYIYIYKDFYENVYSSRTLAKLSVFIISAAFHEYVLGFSIGFCLPILSLQFLLMGIPFTMLRFKSKLIGNIFVLFTLALGMSIILSVYTIEFYSRVNCPIQNFTFYDYFVPHLFNCNK